MLVQSQAVRSSHMSIRKKMAAFEGVESLISSAAGDIEDDSTVAEAHQTPESNEDLSWNVMAYDVH